MGRITKAYEAKFELLLKRFGARRMAAGVAWCRRRAETQSRHQGISLARTLEEAHAVLRAKADAFRRTLPENAAGSTSTQGPEQVPVRFLCDAGLGGLARWLRAAGYEALCNPELDDNAILSEARRSRALLLTTDSLLMERRLLRDGVVPGFWLPPTLKPVEQLERVLREWNLSLQTPRCMPCGGALKRVDKREVWERIPPRTRLWLDEYYQCERCRQLFWHGTHWQRIRQALERVAAMNPPKSESSNPKSETN